MSKKHRGRYQGDPVTYQLPSPAGGVQLETFVPWTLVKRGLKKQIITPLDAPQEFMEEARRERQACESAQDTALLRALVDARLSPSVRAEIGYGASRAALEDAAKARRRLDKNVWSAAMLSRAVEAATLPPLHGADAGVKPARSLLDQARSQLNFINLRDASAHEDLPTLTALLANLSA